jgi:hypothetical protein
MSIMIGPPALPLEFKKIIMEDGVTSLYDATIVIIASIIEGLPEERAYVGAGHTVREMLDKMQRYPAVMRAINFAVNKNISWWTAILKEGATKDWRASAYYLSCMYPSRFAEVRAVLRKDAVATTDETIKAKPKLEEIDLEKLTDEELHELAKG